MNSKYKLLSLVFHRRWKHQMRDENQGIVELQHAIYNSKNPTRNWLHNLRRIKIEKAISDLNLPKAISALEIGPGSGIYLPFLCNKFSSVDALDIEKAHLDDIAYLQDKYENLGLIEADLFSFSKNCKGYDFILCSEVIEHVENPQAFFSAICDCLKPNGIIVLSTPQPFSFLELIGKIALSPILIWLPRFLYNEPVLPTGHISLVSRKTLTRYCDNNSISVEYTECFGLYLPIVAEAFGQTGLKLERVAEKFLKYIGVFWPLWTQLHVLKK